VVNAKALQIPERDLLVGPYTLGAWLGDGTSASAQITSADPEIIMNIEAEGVEAHKSDTAIYRYQLRLDWSPGLLYFAHQHRRGCFPPSD
jgi:replicative DNA helicase